MFYKVSSNNTKTRLFKHTASIQYVDDTTVSEILAPDEDSRMQSALDELITWSDSNYMKVNSKKTKEMILGQLRKQQPLPLLISNHNVEQVTSFKLLGVTINDALKWDDNIAAVTSKAVKRLWFLKKSSVLAYLKLIWSTTIKLI